MATAEVLLIGGGGGGADTGSGGGAGGYVYQTDYDLTSATISVGAGGAGGERDGERSGANGGDSVLGELTAYGGGGGTTHGSFAGLDGGCGAGAPMRSSAPTATAGIGSQGFDGGGGYVQASWQGWCGGGGGIGAAGNNAGNTTNAGRGGNGLAFSITGSSVTYGGGGGGGDIHGANYSGAGSAGTGGGGRANYNAAGTSGTDGLGGGGGGGSYTGSTANGGPYTAGGNGGSGVVIIAYDDSLPDLAIPEGLTYDTPSRSGYKVYRFTAGSGTVAFDVETFDEVASGGIVAAGSSLAIGGWLPTACSICNSFFEEGQGGCSVGGAVSSSFFGTSGGSVLGGSAVVDMPLDVHDGLESVWALIEADSPYIDSASGNNGTTSFPPTQDDGLLCSYSQAFTERNFITLPADSIGPTASFSVSLHAKINGYYQQRTWFTRGSGDYWKFRLGHTVANHAWASVQLLDSSDELITVDVFSTTLLAREKWYHVAAVWNGKLSLYVNGSLEAESDSSPYSLPDNATGGHIGRWKGFGCESNLQELRLYPEAYGASFWTAERDNFCKPGFFLVAETDDLLS